MSKISNKFYITVFFILFAISTTMLLIASTAMTPLPARGGYLDVGIVVLIALTSFTIHPRNKSLPRYDISHQIAIYLFPLILVDTWLYRDSLDLNTLLPGLAWRTYFFFSIPPHAINLWKTEQVQ